MPEFFHNGGWPMWPILFNGLWLLLAALRYARRPDAPRRVLLRGLAQSTLLLGVLGTVLGLIATLNGVAPLLPDKAFLVLIGFGESINNLAFALSFVVVAAIIKIFGDHAAARDGAGGPLPAGD